MEVIFSFRFYSTSYLLMPNSKTKTIQLWRLFHSQRTLTTMLRPAMDYSLLWTSPKRPIALCSA